MLVHEHQLGITARGVYRTQHCGQDTMSTCVCNWQANINQCSETGWYPPAGVALSTMPAHAKEHFGVFVLLLPQLQCHGCARTATGWPILVLLLPLPLRWWCCPMVLVALALTMHLPWLLLVIKNKRQGSLVLNAACCDSSLLMKLHSSERHMVVR